MVAWSCSIFDGKVSWDEWVLRTLQAERRPRWFTSPGKGRKTAYFVAKVKDVTWVRKSKKTADYGWDTSIHRDFRMDVYVDQDRLPQGLYSTKLQAAKNTLKRKEADLKRWLSEREAEKGNWSDEDWTALNQETKRDVAAAKANLTRIQNARKNK